MPAGGSYAIPCNKSEKLIRTVDPSVSYNEKLEAANRKVERLIGLSETMGQFFNVNCANKVVFGSGESWLTEEKQPSADILHGYQSYFMIVVLATFNHIPPPKESLP